MKALGLAMVLLAIAWTVARLAGGLVTAAWSARAPAEPAHPHPWARHTLPLLLAPAVLGVAAALGAIVPSRPSVWLAGMCPCEAMPWAGFHLCVVHPGHASPLMPIGAAIVTGLVLDLAPRLWKLLGAVRAARRLRIAARRDGAVWTLDMGGAVGAFTAGAWSPRVCVDGTWWRALDDEGRAIVVAHEGAHVAHRDPAMRLVVEVLSLIVAPRAGRPLVEAWRLAAELRADHHAALRVGDPVRVARFLVAQARSGQSPVLAMGLSGPAIECRVRALISGTLPAPARPANQSWFALTGASVAVLSTLGPLLHQAAEWFMNSLR